MAQQYNTKYKNLGLKVGLEIHQQLNTKKLFCNCPSTIRDDDPDFEVYRTLRAVAGEGGEIDVAALHEQMKQKGFRYDAYRNTNCEVELDESPPFSMNQDALTATLQIAQLTKANIVRTVQVMRKTVVDGSNTSGFQRTALIAQDGTLKTKEGTITIPTICIEEDSARPVKEINGQVHYRLDRLGIPLIELATGPDIHSPAQAKAAAEKIGMILRSIPKVKRGIGTIRQDVNVSIKGGTRIKIKGAQDLKLLPKLIEYEATRQHTLLTIKKELQKRKAKVPSTITDITSTLKKSDSNIIKKTIKNKETIHAIKLPGFVGLIGKEVQPNRRLGTEFADHAKVRAGVGGIFHSDELPAYGITKQEVETIRKKLKCTKNDSFILVAAKNKTAKTALEAVIYRAQQTIEGVPSEVRKANENGTTNYLRPMPGADRMYPETDIPLIYPNTKEVELPELIEQKIKRFIKTGLGNDLATFVAKSDRAPLFELIVKKNKSIKPAFIAETLTATMRELSRDHNVDTTQITDDDLINLFELLEDNKLSKDSFTNALIDTAKGTFDIINYKEMNSTQLEKELNAIINKNKNLSFGALMGLATKQLQGKASGKDIAEMLKKIQK